MYFLAIFEYLLGLIIILIMIVKVLLQFPFLTLLEPYRIKAWEKFMFCLKSNLYWFTTCMVKSRNIEMDVWGMTIYPDPCQGTHLILGTWFGSIRSSDSSWLWWLFDLFLKILSSLTENAFGSGYLLLETLLKYFTPFKIKFFVTL